jgi:putative YphP/YqiW family bacilliredoxin
MPYPEAFVRPMRDDLTRLGIRELLSAEDVETALTESESGLTLIVINSVCGCAAANARPAVAMALQKGPAPDRSYTVFAGQELEATARLREHLAGIPPSSPFIAVLKDGDPAYIIERRHIEGRSASAIASDIVSALERFSGTEDDAAAGPASPEAVEAPEQENGLPSTFRSIL